MIWVDYLLPKEKLSLSPVLNRDYKRSIWSIAIQGVLRKQLEIPLPPIDFHSQAYLIHKTANQLLKRCALKVTALAMEGPLVTAVRVTPCSDDFVAHPLNILANASRKASLNTDFLLTSGNRSWPCHLAVLASKISLFNNNSQNFYAIPIECVKKSIDYLINYLYEDPIRLPLDTPKEVLIGLKLLARHFDLPFLGRMVREQLEGDKDAFGCHFSFEDELFFALEQRLKNKEQFSWRYQPIIHPSYRKLYDIIIKKAKEAAREGLNELSITIDTEKIVLNPEVAAFYRKALKVKAGTDLHEIQKTEDQNILIRLSFEKDNPILYPMKDRLHGQRLNGAFTNRNLNLKPYHHFVPDLKIYGTPIESLLNDCPELTDCFLEFLYEQPFSNVTAVSSYEGLHKIATQARLFFLSDHLLRTARSEILKNHTLETLEELKESLVNKTDLPLYQLIEDRILELNQHNLKPEDSPPFPYLGNNFVLKLGKIEFKIDELLLTSLSSKLKDQLTALDPRDPRQLYCNEDFTEVEIEALKHYLTHNGNLSSHLKTSNLGNLEAFAKEWELPSLLAELHNRELKLKDPYLHVVMEKLFLLAKKSAKSGETSLECAFNTESDLQATPKRQISLLAPGLKALYGIQLESWDFLRYSLCTGTIYHVKASWKQDNLKVLPVKERFQLARKKVESLDISIQCGNETFHCHSTLLKAYAKNFPVEALGLIPHALHWKSNTPPNVMRFFLNSLYSDDVIPIEQLTPDEREELLCLHDMLGI